MNFKEAYQKMLEGKKVKRKGRSMCCFYDSNENKFCTGDGVAITGIAFEAALAEDWEVVEETKSKVWKPNIGENYFFITSSLEVNKFTNEGDMVDESIISSYNCFKTEEEAQHMIEKLKVIKELQNFALENRDEEISWNEDSRYKFYIYFDYKWKMIRITWATVEHGSPFNIYFASEKAIHDAIDSIGEERIKKYYFDVKD